MQNTITIGTQIFWKSSSLKNQFVGEVIDHTEKAVKVAYAILTPGFVETYSRSVWIPKSLITTDKRFESPVYVAKPFFGNNLFTNSYKEPIQEFQYINGTKVYC
jgi:hypothetical protein